MTENRVGILLIGGGVASAAAAGELRERGYDGTIAIATREQDPPYHRPPITKGYLLGRQPRMTTYFWLARWYERNSVYVLPRTPVSELDVEARTAKLGRDVVGFDQALVATGVMVRRLQAEGGQRGRIHYLRTLGNAEALRDDAMAAERIAIVGGSYIATEAAATLSMLGKRCTIVMQESLPLERGFGPVVGRFVRDLLASHGVEFVEQADVVAFDGDSADPDGPVQAVVCADGRRIECDVAVVGVGSVPDVALARKAGLELGETGGIACDSSLRTSAPGIFAAGDACEYDSVLHGRRLRVEHEDVATGHGRHVARAMLGADEPFAEVPYFWSDLATWAKLEYVGPAASWDDEIVRGDPASGAFSVFYLDAGRVVAALSVGRRADLDAARAMLAEGAGADAVHALA